MKQQTTKKLFAFIITAMMFSVMPVLVKAQKKCPDGNCPTGQVCFGGYCVKSGGCPGNQVPVLYSCGTRSAPRLCVKCEPPGHVAKHQAEGWKTPASETTLTNIYYFGSQPAAISFSLDKPEKISAKIFDMTGQLVKTFADQFFEEGEHSIEWNTTGVNEGVYTLQLQSAPFSHMEKLVVMK